jgi:hypothetical protein
MSAQTDTASKLGNGSLAPRIAAKEPATASWRTSNDQRTQDRDSAVFSRTPFCAAATRCQATIFSQEELPEKRLAFFVGARSACSVMPYITFDQFGHSCGFRP